MGASMLQIKFDAFSLVHTAEYITSPSNIITEVLS